MYNFSQTLITLNLSDNKINDEGGKCLANAVEQNKVHILNHSTSNATIYLLFLIDSYHT